MLDALAGPDSIGRRANALPPPFDCSWTNGSPDAAWVHVAGELDVATTPQLVRTLRDPQLQAPLVVLDLRGLEFIDGSAVHGIVDASIRTRRVDRRLVVLRGPPNLDRMLTLTGNSDHVEMGDVGSLEPAVQMLVHLDEDRAS